MLLIAREIAPFGGYGLGAQVRALARDLVAEGCDVHVLVSPFSGHSGVSSEKFDLHMPLGGAPFHAPSPVSEGLQQQVGMFSEAIDMYLREASFDVLHVHGEGCASLAHALRRVRGTPLIATFHRLPPLEVGEHETPEDRYSQEMAAWLGEAADMLVCHSHFAAAQARRVYGLTADKLVVLPLLVKTEDWETDADLQAFRELFGPPGSELVTFTGRLQESKGPQILVESLPHVAAVAPRARVVIAGDGPLGPALRERVKRLGLESMVTFPGYLAGKVLTTLLRASRVHVSPSFVEASGAATVEAMVCGVPVVAAAGTGVAELVQHESHGLLVPPGDPRALAEAVVRMLYDGPLASRLATAGRQRIVEQCGTVPATTSVLALYSRLRR